MTNDASQRFWRRTKRLTLVLLVLWGAVNLLLPWFARSLNNWHWFGLPLGWWLASGGALLVYLAIIVVDIVAMERLEAAYRDGAAPAAPDAAGPPA